MNFNIKPPKYFVGAAVCAALMGGVILIKDILAGKNYTGKEQVTGKTVIVTGATTGIGKETALELARRGARVIMACRDQNKCKKVRNEIALATRNKEIVCRQCDLASQKSVREFTALINETEPRLDVLINNAGVMRCPRSTTLEGIELQLGTNHMAHFLLTNLLLDKLKACAPSRIVNISSVAHMRGSINFSDLNSEKNYDPGAAYNQSKLANILFTRELSDRLMGTNVTCNAVHPGIVNTELARHLGISKSWIAAVFAKPIMWFFLKTPQKGSQTSIFVAVNADLEGVTGKYFSNMAEAAVAEAAQDKEAAIRLWAISERWTQLVTSEDKSTF